MNTLTFILLALGTILLVCILMALIGVFSAIFTYGGFIDSDKYYPILIEQKKKGISLNRHNKSILNVGNLPYISPTKTIFSKHHIDSYGIIWKWSKLSKLIDEIYIEALTKE